MLEISEMTQPIDQADHALQRATLQGEAGKVAVTAFLPPQAASLDQGPFEQAGVICPGFLEPMDHPSIAGIAAMLASRTNTVMLSFDPRGMHCSNDSESRYAPQQTINDMVNIAKLLAPSKATVLGGQSIGGVFALRAAVELQQTVRSLKVFTVKTPHIATAHQPFTNLRAKAATGRPFFGADATGQLVRKPVHVTSDAFQEHEENSGVGTFVAALQKDSGKLSVLLTASPQDTEMPLQPIQAISADFPNVTFSRVAGEHHDRCPETIAATAVVITSWLVATS